MAYSFFVTNVVKHVVIKSAPDLMWSGIMGADSFIYGNCGQSMWSVSCGSACLGWCIVTLFESVCQEVSRVNIWDAVVKEKGREKGTTVEQITRSLNSFEIPIAFWRKK